MANSLEEARKIIDEADAAMAVLFEKRLQREEAVIKKNAALVQDEALRGYYIDCQRHLMSVSRAYQQRLQEGVKVAYSGVEGAFAHIAATRVFPAGRHMPYSDFKAA